MKFNNPKVLADALSNLDIQPDPTKTIEIQDTVVPTVLIAGGSSTIASVEVGYSLTRINATRTTTGTTTMGTVPAGKVWRIYGSAVQLNFPASTGTTSNAFIRIGTEHINDYSSTTLTAVGVAGLPTSSVMYAPGYIEAVAGTVIYFELATANAACYANLYYVELNA